MHISFRQQKQQQTSNKSHSLVLILWYRQKKEIWSKKEFCRFCFVCPTNLFQFNFSFSLSVSLLFLFLTNTRMLTPAMASSIIVSISLAVVAAAQTQCGNNEDTSDCGVSNDLCSHRIRFIEEC